MLFNSYPFVFVFLPLLLLGYWLLARAGIKQAIPFFLIAASLSFYGWWNWKYLFLFGFSILFNYALGPSLAPSAATEASDASKRHLTRQAQPTPRQRSGGEYSGKTVRLAFAVAVNLGLLGYFKYRNFFIDNLNTVTGSDWALAPLVLPLAISFHTFQQIAYLVDCYRRKVEQPPLLSYALFVLFFPQLVAGPIVHHYQLLPQLRDKRIYTFDYGSLATGLCFFIFGLAKKLLIADPLSFISDPIFDGAIIHHPALAQTWIGLCAYTLAIYFDFSGYSDMAVGLARMFGIRLPYNFASPYKATSIVDFWRRWHITLSNWLRDYLYIPLGGNRHGKARRYANLIITMLLGGLWHGAAWTFVLWGLLHGTYLMVAHMWGALRGRITYRGTPLHIPAPAAWALTFLAVSFAWVFFRSHSMAHAFAMLEGLAGLNGLVSQRLAIEFDPAKMLLLGMALVIALLMPNSQQLVDQAAGPGGRLRLHWHPTPAWSAAVAALLLLSLMRMSNVREFVYFQF